MRRQKSVTFEKKNNNNNKKTVAHKYTNDKSYHKVRDHCHYTGK